MSAIVNIDILYTKHLIYHIDHIYISIDNVYSKLSPHLFEDYYNYVIGNLPHNSSLLKYFDLTLIEGKGIILRYPSMYDTGKIVKYTHHAQFFNCIDEYLNWAKILNISSIGELNDAIVNGKPGELINLSESIQNFRLQQIASQISEQKDNIKFILISGPSSSGKTTSARK